MVVGDDPYRRTATVFRSCAQRGSAVVGPKAMVAISVPAGTIAAMNETDRSYGSGAQARAADALAPAGVRLAFLALVVIVAIGFGARISYTTATPPGLEQLRVESIASYTPVDATIDSSSDTTNDEPWWKTLNQPTAAITTKYLLADGSDATLAVELLVSTAAMDGWVLSRQDSTNATMHKSVNGRDITLIADASTAAPASQTILTLTIQNR